MSVLADGGKNEGVISGHKFKRADIVHVQAKAKDYLMHVDEMLDDCFRSLANYTGEGWESISSDKLSGNRNWNLYCILRKRSRINNLSPTAFT